MFFSEAVTISHDGPWWTDNGRDDQMDDERINQLSMYEQNLQQILMQRQSFQSQLLEVESAHKEVLSSNTVYKIIGNVMVLSDKASVDDDLSERKKMLELRVASLEKQEKILKSKAESLQKEILEGMKSKKSGISGE